MSSFTIGWFEYRFTNLVGTREGSKVSWTAEISIIDKMGWEDEKYGVMFSDMLDYVLPEKWAYAIGPKVNVIPNFIFGPPNREFSRGKFQLKGVTDCCNLDFIGWEESFFPLGGL